MIEYNYNNSIYNPDFDVIEISIIEQNIIGLLYMTWEESKKEISIFFNELLTDIDKQKLDIILQSYQEQL